MKPATFDIDEAGETTLNLCNPVTDDPWAYALTVEIDDEGITCPEEWELL
jgi:hypothetical protein